uniref:Uncharacterized protein n=1 Tax=Setaria viridis TaxID=4556 RepID=A0A4U6VGC8_SETVI|nr:hypothetical protein SEVIR_3G185200v2 [Setaria viridis]
MCKVKCICRYNIEVVPCSLPCADLKQTNVLTRFVLVKQTASQLETNSSELRLLPAFLQKTADTNVQQQVLNDFRVHWSVFWLNRQRLSLKLTEPTGLKLTVPS